MAKRAAVKKPRMRKLEPTVRERIQDKPAKSKKRRLVSLPPGTLTNNPVLKVFAIPFKLLFKILNWLVPRYFINAWRELRLVTWPSRRETWRLTGAVFIFAIVFGVIITFVDRGLDNLFKHTVLK